MKRVAAHEPLLARSLETREREDAAYITSTTVDVDSIYRGTTSLDFLDTSTA